MEIIVKIGLMTANGRIDVIYARATVRGGTNPMMQ
jgi:hypothetical protein